MLGTDADWVAPLLQLAFLTASCPTCPGENVSIRMIKIHKTQNVHTQIKFVYFMQVCVCVYIYIYIYIVSVTDSGQFRFLWQCTSPNTNCRMLMSTWKQYLNINHTSCRFVNWSIQLFFSLSFFSFFFFHLKTRGMKLQKIIARGSQKLQIIPKESQQCILHRQFSPVSRLS